MKNFLFKELIILVVLAMVVSCSDNDQINVSDLPAEPQENHEILNTDEASSVALLVSKTPAFLESKKLEGEERVSSIQSTSPKEVKEIIPINDLNDQPAMYAANYSDGGFAIVSATTKESPILAFSDKGAFKPDELSNGAIDFLYERMEYIQAAKENDSIKASEKTIQELNDLLANDRENNAEIASVSTKVEFNNDGVDSVKIGRAQRYVTTSRQIRVIGRLLSTAWSQFGVYNDLVQTKGGCSNAPVGCVAVAGAQVVNYWQKGGGLQLVCSK